MKNPQLIVFDLDYTLWDCGGTWCDCLTPPFLQTTSGPEDRYGRIVTLYNDVMEILDWCDSQGITMALASRTGEPAWARELLKMLRVNERFKYNEIFPSTKLIHFKNLQKSSGLEFKNMLFFDDEMRNIREVGELGVESIFVEDGLNLPLFEKGLAKWRKNTS
ncbi:MAG: magnesium-dependent phosphatase-1 [Lentisphaeraceae bacterium]|nr:magnesium-dependent phosphatase-1 [Lentisphaeraceae bacterium]